MRVFSFSFQNLKERPNEDFYLVSQKHPIFTVADGVTRYVKNNKKYPKITGAGLAAEEFCRATLNYLEKNFKKADFKILKESFNFANKAIFNLNEKYEINKELDYLENDYFSTCGAAAFIKKNILHYGYVGDCGIRIYNKDNHLKFISIDDVAPLEELRGNSNFESEDERMLFWHKVLRNKPNSPYLTYGVFTGEPEVKHYYHSGKIRLQKGDFVFLYSDGFLYFLKKTGFRKLFITRKENQLFKEINGFIKREIKLRREIKESTETFFDDKTLISILV